MGHPPIDDWGVESVSDPSSSSDRTTSSFRRVVHKVNRNAKCRCCLWVIAVWCAATVVFMLFGYDTVVEKVATGQLVLKQDGGQKFEAWKVSPVPVYYKVHVFNLTNPVSFMAGARPRMKECGPYSYRMIDEKIDVNFHTNNSVTYRSKPMYIFEPSLSVGSEEDTIYTVNIPMVNAADAVKDGAFLRMIIQVAQKIHGFKTLRNLSVRELLWGYKSHVIDWARTLQDVPFPHSQFGLLVGFNNTPQEPYTMYTGAADANNMNTIYSWNGKTSMNFWFGERCNRIMGTDAGGFHPGVTKEERLYIFNGQLCRSLPLVYDKTVDHSNVETYRFVPPNDIFDYGPMHPENKCFCTHEGCPRQGLMDMKPCYYGAAVAFSFPHFYQADPTLAHVVQGMRPDPELHGTHFDIYPQLGIPVRVKLRMQMNVVIDGSAALQRARHFDLVFPIFWFEAGIDSLPQEMVGMLKMAQDLPGVIKTSSVVVCGFLSVVFLVLLFVSSIAGWCGLSVDDDSRTITPDHLPENQAGPWPPHKNAVDFTSGYRPASMTSLNPGDSFILPPPSFPDDVGNRPPPFKGGLYPPTDEMDGTYCTASEELPAYSSKPGTLTKGSTTTTTSYLSVEVHSSSDDKDELSDDRCTPSSEDLGCPGEPDGVVPTAPPTARGMTPTAPAVFGDDPSVREDEAHRAFKCPGDAPKALATSSLNTSQASSIPSPNRPPPLESDL